MKRTDIMTDWLVGYSPSSARGLAFDLRQFQATVKKAWPKVTAKDIASYLDGLTGVTPGVMRRKVSSLHSFFRFAAKHGVVPVDVAATYRNRWPEKPRSIKTFTVAEVEKIIAAAQDQREFLFVTLAYYCAMTIGEIAKLQWRDINFKTNRVTVRTSPRKRVIEFSVEIFEVLLDYRDGAKDSLPVFRSRVGGGSKVISVRHAARIVQEVIARSGLTGSIQTLRNSHASHVIALGASLADVQIALGHRTARSTARHAQASSEKTAKTGLML
jgi:site-specific recombinase XerD